MTDTNGLQVFAQAADVVEQHGMRVGLARVKTALQRSLEDAGIWNRYASLVFDRVADTVSAYDRQHPAATT